MVMFICDWGDRPRQFDTRNKHFCATSTGKMSRYGQMLPFGREEQLGENIVVKNPDQLPAIKPPSQRHESFTMKPSLVDDLGRRRGRLA